MGHRYITIPESVTLTNPDNPDDSMVVSFEFIMKKLRNHPQWLQSMDYMDAALNIREAFKAAAAGDGVMELTEDDWLKLKEAAMNPKEVAIMNGQQGTRLGLGFSPISTPDLLPLLKIITDSPPTKRPKTLSVVTEG